MTEPVGERSLSLPRESEWVFTTIRGTHYTPSARCFHWNRVRCAVGLGNAPMYLCTRHHFGWLALNVLELPPHVIALQLGHEDGGRLVRDCTGTLTLASPGVGSGMRCVPWPRWRPLSHAVSHDRLYRQH